ncbi:MAG: C13 family peptidase [Moraxella equi]|nr:C13 family peptidase [Moraxella equi]
MSLESLKIQSLPRFSLNFAANIVAALWMLVGSVRAFNWVKPTFGQFVLFALLALAVNILLAWLTANFGSDFNEQGLISYLIWPTIMLIAGILLAKRTLNYSLLFVPVILWLVADTLLILVQSGMQFLSLQNWLPNWMYHILPDLFVALFVWQTAALLLIFAKRLHWQWWERVIMMMGAIALLVVWQKNVADQPIFKVKNQNPTISETAFYAQPMILADHLANIEKSETGETDWYFMGVAGYSELDVFTNEIEQAKQLFDVRFGTKGKSIALINNPNTWQSDPIATKTSIHETLQTIGKQMNADEDVLFLTLSSHGAVDESGQILGDLVLDNPPLDLDDIDPVWLKETLDASGIRWRVIVISSCYSGAFIESLASPTTLIITASAADRASFGCGHNADLSYFGRAFFAEGLRGDKNTFDNAYAHTKKRVGELEALMGFTPSEPQMYVGSLMKTALPELEQTLFDNSQEPTMPADGKP